VKGKKKELNKIRPGWGLWIKEMAWYVVVEKGP
jgi:hypothetical protein